jgi:hypothetical protein
MYSHEANSTATAAKQVPSTFMLLLLELQSQADGQSHVQ